MRVRSRATAWISGISLLLVSLSAGNGSDSAARVAIEKALPYLAEEGQWWIDKKKCVSCHHTGLLIWSHQLAGARGIPIDSGKLGEWSSWAIGHQLSRRKDEKGNYRPGLVGSANIEGLAQLILGTPAETRDKHRGDFETFRELIRTGQEKNDSWKPGGQLPFQKRPEPETRAVSTMWAALALDAYGGDDIRDRALAYLRENPVSGATSTEHAAMRLILTSRFGTDDESAAALEGLLDRQNPDGGWSWSDGDPSGPMATGQALLALAESGADLGAFRSAVDHARRYLEETQRDEGSWETRSTKTKNQGKSNEVSDFYGSSWAVIGLARTLPETDRKSGNLTARSR